MTYKHPATTTGWELVNAADAAAARESIDAASRAAIYYATDHGVVADGTTNALSALNTLITTVSAAGGGVVLLPVGTVKVNGQVAMASNVTLRGHGWDSVILLGADVAGAGVVNISTGDSNVTIEDLKIDGDRASFTSDKVAFGIYGSGGGYENVLVRNVWVTGTTYNGITFLGSHHPSATNARDRVTRNIRIVDCLVDDCGSSPILVIGGVDQVWIDRCTVREFGRGPAGGVGITVGRYSYDSQVTNCLIDGTDNPHAEGHGISLDTVYSRVNCSGNTLLNCKGYGIEIGHIVDGTVSDNTIIGGERTAIAFTSTLTPADYSIRSNMSVTVTGNVVQGTASNGIGFIYNDSTSGQNCPANATTLRSTAYTAAATTRVVDGRRLYECTTTGTTAASKPAGWGTSVTGGTVTDGTTVWTDRGNTNNLVAISGNVVRDIGGVGVYLTYCHNVSVTGNTITGTGLSGIKAESNANMYTVTGNDVQGCNHTAAAGHGGIVFNAYTGASHIAKVHNNRVANSGVINMMAVDSGSGLRIDDRFLANTTSPSVAFGGFFITQNTQTTTIATMPNPNSVEGRVVMVRVNDAYTTFQHSSSGTTTLRLLGGVNFTAPAGTHITFMWYNTGLQWIEVARSTNISGAALRTIQTVTSSAVLGAAGDYLVFIGSGGAPTLPTAVGNTGRYSLKNITTTDRTIATTSSQTIDGETGLTLPAGVSVDLVSDGSNWRIF